jgi:heat-inducible transcriptional repressor
MVLVTVGGRVRQQMLVLSEPVTQGQLTTTAEHLNSLLHDRDAEKIKSVSTSEMDALTADMFKLILDELVRSESMTTGEMFQDGWTNVFAEPEFAESKTALRALRVLEERPILENVLSETVKDTEIGGVQVLIGGEGNWEELSDCTLVLARYGVPNLATGILGVLGPIRMPYQHTIPTVDFMASLLSGLVSESMSDVSVND